MTIRACAFLLAGGVAAQHSRVPLDALQCYALFVTAILLLCCRRWRKTAVFALAAITGYGAFIVAANAEIATKLDARYAGDSMVVAVRIVSFPQRNGDLITFRVEPVSDLRVPRVVSLSWYEPGLQPAIGQLWQFEVRLKRPRGYASPGAFDREAWLFRESVSATGYVVSGKRNTMLNESVLGLRDDLRQDYLRRLDNVAAADPGKGILAAITVGVRHAISDAQWQNFSITGTSHLMAISGLHIGLAASLALAISVFAFGALRFVHNALDISFVIAALVAGVYGYVTGFGVPAQRATIMLALVAATVICRRQALMPEILLLAAAIVYLVKPISVMTPGFALSFSAVALLLSYSQRLLAPPGMTTWTMKACSRLRSVVAIQVHLLVGLMPLTVSWFHRVPLLAPLANLVVVPVFSLIVIPLALLGLVASSASDFLTDNSMLISLWVIQKTQLFTQGLAAIPMTDIATVGVDIRVAAVFVLLGAWVCLPRQWPGRWLAIIAVLWLVQYQPPRPDQGCFVAHILDVGQGSAHLVQTRTRNLLFDSGVRYRNGGSVAEQVVIPFLRHIGVRKLDYLVISHADLDHAGGVDALLASLSIDEVFVGEPLVQFESGAYSSRSMPCRANHTWQVDGVRFRFLHPQESGNAGNDASCVLQVRAGDHSLLLTGDIEAAGERRLLDSSADLKTDVVVVPHHGSKTSSTPAFVAATRPVLAIASAGFGNRWEFPNQEVVARWQQSGTRFLSIAETGTVSMKICERQGLRAVQEFRHEQRRFWRE